MCHETLNTATKLEIENVQLSDKLKFFKIGFKQLKAKLEKIKNQRNEIALQLETKKKENENNTNQINILESKNIALLKKIDEYKNQIANQKEIINSLENKNTDSKHSTLNSPQTNKKTAVCSFCFYNFFFYV